MGLSPRLNGLGDGHASVVVPTGHPKLIQQPFGTRTVIRFDRLHPPRGVGQRGCVRGLRHERHPTCRRQHLGLRSGNEPVPAPVPFQRHQLLPTGPARRARSGSRATPLPKATSRRCAGITAHTATRRSTSVPSRSTLVNMSTHGESTPSRHPGWSRNSWVDHAQCQWRCACLDNATAKGWRMTSNLDTPCAAGADNKPVANTSFTRSLCAPAGFLPTLSRSVLRVM